MPGALAVCLLPPTPPAGPTAVVTDPTPVSTTTIDVALAPVAGATQYRVTLTEVPSTAGRRLLSSVITITQASNLFSFVAGEEADSEWDGGRAALGCYPIAVAGCSALVLGLLYDACWRLPRSGAPLQPVHAQLAADRRRCALSTPAADGVVIPELCGRAWDVEGFWINAAGPSTAVSGNRVTMPDCNTPECIAAGESCTPEVAENCCVVEGTAYVCRENAPEASRRKLAQTYSCQAPLPPPE